EGGNLRDFLNIRKKLEPGEGMRLLEDAASAMAFAFSKGITHRDMKLTNVLISSQGQAKLVDFGLAGLYGQAQQEKDKSNVDRTVDYAGLENASGAPQNDIRSDIYFLGCVAYEMLTGTSPLEMTKDARARMNRERFLSVVPLRPDDHQLPAPVCRL